MFFFKLYIAKCEDPQRTMLNDSLLTVTGYRGPPALEGTAIGFYCSSGFVLIGNNTATCLTSGQWQPYLREIMCSEGE